MSENEASLTPNIRRANSPNRFSTVKLSSSSSSSVNALTGTLGAPTLDTNTIQRDSKFLHKPIQHHEHTPHNTSDVHSHNQYHTEPLGQQLYRGQGHSPIVLPEVGHAHFAHVDATHSDHDHSRHGHGHQEDDHHHDHHHDHGHHEHGHHHGHAPHDHGHDHHHHDHHHDHGHGHDHDHSHGHGHDHNHHHAGGTPSTNLPPLLSVVKNLSPPEKYHLLWCLIHLAIGMSTFVYGHTVESVAFIGLGYLEIFDALGVLNGLYSIVVRTRNVYKEAGPGYPYGAQRYEILYSFVNTIYLLFTAIYMCKEGLEHMLMPHHKEEFEGGFSVVVVTFVGVCATLYSAVQYQNHRQLCILQCPHISDALDQAYYRKDVGAILRYNQFVLTTIGCAIGVGVLFSMASQPALSGFDPYVALVEGALMFYLAGPTSKALARVLLQGTPNERILDVDRMVRDITSWPNVVSCTSPHFWTNSFGNLVGTIEINISRTANEQEVLGHVRRLLGDVVKDVTVQVTKE